MSLDEEAKVLSIYLVSEPCDHATAEAYARGVDTLVIQFSDDHTTVWVKMMQNRFILRSVDSALAITSPSNLLRKRIYLMLCLLEADRTHVDKFLPQKRRVFYLIKLTLVGIRAVLAAIIGLALLKTYKIP